MIRLACPIATCSTTWVLHPEAVDERIRQVTEHTEDAHGWADAERCVRANNSAEIRKAYDELRTPTDRQHRRAPHRSR